MSSNNLRIISQNLVDYSSTTITASSSATACPATNLTKDAKSLVWRSGTSSTTSVKVMLVITNVSNSIGAVVLPFTNLSSTANIRIRGYTGTAPTLSGTVDAPIATNLGTLVFDSGTVLASPYATLDVWNGSTQVSGSNSYAYGGGVYGRVWLSSQYVCTSLLIEITDTNPNKYIEVSRLVIGPYWSPKFNTSFGLSSSMIDLSTSNRTSSGDLVLTRGPRHSTLKFDLNWLTPIDRQAFSNIIKYSGISKPLLISLFPNNSDDYYREKDHQIYGNLVQLPSIQQNIVDMYSSQIDIEEV